MSSEFVMVAYHVYDGSSNISRLHIVILAASAMHESLWWLLQ